VSQSPSSAAFGPFRHRGAGIVVTMAVAIFACGYGVGSEARRALGARGDAPALIADGARAGFFGSHSFGSHSFGARSFDARRFGTRSYATRSFDSDAAPRGFDPQRVYIAEVVRVIDGDTFQARVRVWPGLDVDTRVRLRDIDAPELHARCASEYAKAEAARVALQTMLAAGGVTISRIGRDKYAGRVDAAVATRDIADVSMALLSGGFARSYDGGRRGSWC
jgi:endonuclease YncB( thermonuclease family)